MSQAPPNPATVYDLLAASASRPTTLSTLEAHPPPLERALALAAAPALAELLTVSADDVDAATYQRAGLLLARLHAEMPDDPSIIFGAAYGGGRRALLFNSEDSVLARALRKPAAQLTAEDALSYACMEAHWVPAHVRGHTPLISSEGLPLPEYMKLFRMHSKAKLADDGVPLRIVTLLLELLRAPPSGVPELALAGAWMGLVKCLNTHPVVAKPALESGIFDLAASAVTETGSAADWISISKGKGGRAGIALMAAGTVSRGYQADKERPDKDAFVESGMFDLCCAGVQAYVQRGESCVADTDVAALYACLSPISKLADRPGCEQKIRGIASALAWCIDHDQDWIGAIGLMTSQYAVSTCARVFGRVRLNVLRSALLSSALFL